VRVAALADSVDARVPQSIATLHELHLFILIWWSSLLSRIRYALPVFSFHFTPSSTFIQSSRTKTDDCVPDSSIGVMIFVLSSSLTVFEGQRKAVQLDNGVTNPMAAIEEPEVPAGIGSMELIFRC